MLSLHAKTDYIEWIHEPTIPLYNEKKETAVRVNACKYDKNGNKKKYTEETAHVHKTRSVFRMNELWRSIRQIK